ncbi:PEP-CTERM sorting domain-containing protein [Aeoliella sp.]|uniref:PEP-CTERM sorting domain-containing protein n=1 Tax=Aeoliella sp. TaxID=2795800 RepID=UPI003CCBF4E4
MKLSAVWSPLACLAVLAITASSLNAQTVLIDFGNDSSFRGISVPGPDSNGNSWTSVWSGAYYPNLVDTAGNPTPFAFGFDPSAPGGTDSYNGPAGATDSGVPADHLVNVDIDAAALGDLGGSLEAAIDFSDNARFQVQGLDPSKTYDLTFFGSHKYNNNNTTTYSLHDVGFVNQFESVDLVVGVNELHNRDMTATLSGVSPQPDGILYVQSLGYINAMSVTAVPEPGAIALLAGGCGLLAIVARRRKRA